jgi:hypothetical protein
VRGGFHSTAKLGLNWQLISYVNLIKVYLTGSRCFLWWSLLSFAVPWIGLGQTPDDRVDYLIECTLDPDHKILKASMKVRYHHLMGDTLHELRCHLWMNSLSKPNSPYARQLKALGLRKWLTIPFDPKDAFSHLQFTSESGKQLSFDFIDKSHEILRLELDRVISPGDSYTFHCQFQLKVPPLISRGGYMGSAYHMTQWYPKIARYDSTGWHTMPYLELGEYYNPFGNYEVRINLPPSYRIGATGEIKNSESDSSSGEWIFQAQNVVDFAWFADTNFLIRTDTMNIDDQQIRIQVFSYPNLLSPWNNAVVYAKNALRYLSARMGIYPYPILNLVESPLKTAEAMEYPMISVIDRGYSDPVSLEAVIFHEIAHNWFQASVANNERIEAWLDEGLVTFYEQEFMKNKASKTFLSDAPLSIVSDYRDKSHFSWYVQASHGIDQAPTDPIVGFNTIGYVQSMYERPAKGLALVQEFLGPEAMDTLMRNYYSLYKWRHPAGANLTKLFRNQGLSWYESLYLNSNQKINTRLGIQDNQIRIRQNAGFSIPITLSGYFKNQLIWKKTLISPSDTLVGLPPDSTYYIEADAAFLLPELNRRDNILRLRKSPFVPSKRSLHLLPGIGSSVSQNIYCHPLIARNNANGVFPGLALHNISIPKTSFLFGLLAGYGISSGKWVWLAGFDKTWYAKSKRSPSIRLDGEWRRFSYLDDGDFISQYEKLAGRISLLLPPKNQLAPQRQISLRLIQSRLLESRRSAPFTNISPIVQLKWESIQTKHLFPKEIHSQLELAQKIIKASAVYSIKLPFGGLRGGHHTIRGMAGWMQNNNRFNAVPFSLSGGIQAGYQLDYTWDELLWSRGPEDTESGRQIFNKDASFRTLSRPILFDQWLIGVGYRLKINGWIPIRPYVQWAIGSDGGNGSSQHYTTGCSLVILNDLLELNFPLVESKSIRSGYPDELKSNYFRKINLLLNLRDLNPIKWAHRIGR